MPGGGARRDGARTAAPDGAAADIGERIRAREARSAVAAAARRGELRLPGCVRELRRALGMNQTDFGRMFRLTRRQVSELENGHGDPKASTLARIARAFGLTVGLVPRSALDWGE
jgi:DNA-binding XRE family transcriptional regulator